MEKKDLIEKINNKLIEMLEKGVNPWRKPWRLISHFLPSMFAYNYKTRKPYNGINQIILPPGAYLTFNQIKEEGLKLNKGAKGLTVIRYNVAEVKANETELKTYADTFKDLVEGEVVYIGKTKFFKKNDIIYKSYVMMKNFTVFDVKDCGITVEDEVITPDQKLSRFEAAEKVIKDYIERSKLEFEECYSNEAFYIPLLHKVVVPKIEEYENVAEYYSTVFHELSHSTGHKTLLDRDGITREDFEENEKNRYSKEELIAEISASYCLGDLEIDNEASLNNTASYLNSWASKLKTDKSLSEKIISASNEGNKAYNLIFGY